MGVLKRAMDVVCALTGLVVAAPVIVIFVLAIWLEDRHSPFYLGMRVGRGGVPFKMIKLRSMAVGADRVGPSSTSATDSRITRTGALVRRYKLDELMQLVNVLLGHMSMVGPRPQVPSGVNAYTVGERRLLDVRPGITDFASIVFADEGDILSLHDDPNEAYDKFIRPGKSRLGLFYIDHRSLRVDIELCLLTALAILSREAALQGVRRLLQSCGAESDIVALADRSKPLLAGAPPP